MADVELQSASTSVLEDWCRDFNIKPPQRKLGRRAIIAQLRKHLESTASQAARLPLSAVTKRLRRKTPDPHRLWVHADMRSFDDAVSALTTPSTAVCSNMGFLGKKEHQLEHHHLGHSIAKLPISLSARPLELPTASKHAVPALVWKRCRRKTAMSELSGARAAVPHTVSRKTTGESEALSKACSEDVGPGAALPASPGTSWLSKRRRILMPVLPTREVLTGGEQLLNARSPERLQSEPEDADVHSLPGTPKACQSAGQSSMIKDLTPASKLVRLSIAAAELDVSAREPRLVDFATGMLHVLPSNGVVALGRCVGCEISVQSPVVETRHCVLVCSSGTVTVEDVSASGTAVNDAQLPKGTFLPQPLVLQRGDVLALAPPDGPSFLFLDAACS
ncbi:hypothetical protein AK812_SmicGene22894 [Symbiodinium microadriaticum]|uniref:Uncharacterized protein n=1 Tax=Symbiodinium microadriaticum TaxID=2951 RepID=A0A1Q9DIN2_SYMMI|nr:hypothetical protein AK812_SmicGene22894 [Symbiodinium microadriaticum]CAE7727351.1 unnamed protein product [Symbiodinium microadriaticum]CAE7873620.1 unnamed protein product [Symbiodinium sp. KB8]